MQPDELYSKAGPKRYELRTFVGALGRARVHMAAHTYYVTVTDRHGCVVHNSSHATELAALQDMRYLPWGPWRELVDAREGA